MSTRNPLTLPHPFSILAFIYLAFLLGNFHTHGFVDNETSDTFVTFGEVTSVRKKKSRLELDRSRQVGKIHSLQYLHISKYQKDISFTRIGDPHLGSVQQIMVAFIFSPSLESKSISARSGFREAERTNGIGGQAGKISLLDIRVAILSDEGTHQSVLSYTKHERGASS